MKTNTKAQPTSSCRTSEQCMCEWQLMWLPVTIHVNHVLCVSVFFSIVRLLVICSTSSSFLFCFFIRFCLSHSRPTPFKSKCYGSIDWFAIFVVNPFAIEVDWIVFRYCSAVCTSKNSMENEKRSLEVEWIVRASERVSFESDCLLCIRWCGAKINVKATARKLFNENNFQFEWNARAASNTGHLKYLHNFIQRFPTFRRFEIVLCRLNDKASHKN